MKESVFVVTLISYTVFVFVFFSDRVTNKLSVQAVVGLSLEFELTVNVNFLPNVFCLPGKVQLKRCDTNMYCHYDLHNPAINIYSHKMLDSYRNSQLNHFPAFVQILVIFLTSSLATNAILFVK